MRRLLRKEHTLLLNRDLYGSPLHQRSTEYEAVNLKTKPAPLLRPQSQASQERCWRRYKPEGDCFSSQTSSSIRRCSKRSKHQQFQTTRPDRIKTSQSHIAETGHLNTRRLRAPCPTSIDRIALQAKTSRCRHDLSAHSGHKEPCEKCPPLGHDPF